MSIMFSNSLTFDVNSQEISKIFVAEGERLVNFHNLDRFIIRM